MSFDGAIGAEILSRSSMIADKPWPTEHSSLEMCLPCSINSEPSSLYMQKTFLRPRTPYDMHQNMPYPSYTLLPTNYVYHSSARRSSALGISKHEVSRRMRRSQLRARGVDKRMPLRHERYCYVPKGWLAMIRRHER